MSEGCKSVAAGLNPMDLRRGISLAVDHVVADLKKRAKPISTTEEIAQAGLLCTCCTCGRLHRALKQVACVAASQNHRVYSSGTPAAAPACYKEKSCDLLQ